LLEAARHLHFQAAQPGLLVYYTYFCARGNTAARLLPACKALARPVISCSILLRRDKDGVLSWILTGF
jgi:hypothetical protein